MYKSRESQARTLACDRGAKPWLCVCKAHVQKPRVMGKYISSPSLFYLHMTEAPNHGFAHAKPMYKKTPC